MNEFIEKLIGRLEKEKKEAKMVACTLRNIVLDEAISIVNELAEEYKDRTIINVRYCWQDCSALEHCKECNRLCNGSIDYYENYDFMAEKMGVAKNAITTWIPCSGCEDCQHKECEHNGKV